MKLAASVIAAAMSATPPASSPQDEGLTVRIDAEAAALCKAEGGCGVVTRRYVEEIQRRAFEAGKSQCRSGKEV